MRRLLRTTSILGALLICGTCHPDAQGPTPDAYVLREVRRFGWPEARTDTVSGKRDDTGVLGYVAGLARGNDSTLYVLDGQFNRIVGFQVDGTPHVVVGSRAGDGPGEFRRVSGLSLRGPRLAVLDAALARISLFALDGSLSGLIRVGSSPRRLAWVGETLWVSPTGRPGRLRPIAIGYSETGDSVATGPEPMEEEAFGPGYDLLGDETGRLVVTSVRPGVWYVVSTEAWHRVGEPMFPDMAPPEVRRTGPREISVGVAQAAVVGLGLMGDSLLVQRYRQFSEAPRLDQRPNFDSVRYALAIFRRSGEHLTDVPLELPSLEPNHFFMDPADGHLFVVVLEPYPQIVELALSRDPKTS